MSDVAYYGKTYVLDLLRNLFNAFNMFDHKKVENAEQTVKEMDKDNKEEKMVFWVSRRVQIDKLD